jgi:hypothetical protein
MPAAAMQFLVLIFAIIAAGLYAAFSRFLAHRERMAALEARRPVVLLQLPPGDPGNADRLTDEILAACKAKGIEVDLEIR